MCSGLLGLATFYQSGWFPALRCNRTDLITSECYGCLCLKFYIGDPGNIERDTRIDHRSGNIDYFIKARVDLASSVA